MNELATIKKIEQSKLMIAQVKTLDEIKKMIDQGEALKAYAKSAQLSAEIQADVSELNLRAVRRLGEISAQIEKAKGGQPFQKKSTLSSQGRVETKTAVLNNSGIDIRKAIEAEKIAKIPEKVFEEKIAKAKDASERITKSLFKDDMVSHPVFTSEQLFKSNESLKRVKEYQKTGIKPKGWREGFDDKLVTTARDKQMEKHQKELTKKKEIKIKEGFTWISSDLLLYFNSLKNDDLKITACENIIAMCESFMAKIKLKKLRKAS